MKKTLQGFLFITITLVLLIFLNNCSVMNEPSSRETPDSDATAIKPLSDGVQRIKGVVLSGGDQTPEGLMDAPRKFAYQVQLESGEVITVTYTAYPPSPTGSVEPGPQLSFHKGTITIGDNIIAQGTYEAAAKTLVIEQEKDFIETFPE